MHRALEARKYSTLRRPNLSPIIWTNTCPALSPIINVRSARILQKSSALDRSHTRQTSLFNLNASTRWDAKTNTQSHSHLLWTSTHIGRPATREAPSTNYLRSCHTLEVPTAATTAALPRKKAFLFELDRWTILRNVRNWNGTTTFEWEFGLFNSNS